MCDCERSGGWKRKRKNIYVQHQVFLQSASRIFVHIPNFLKAKSLVKKTIHCLNTNNKYMYKFFDSIGQIKSILTT